jgi:hypothetical protein
MKRGNYMNNQSKYLKKVNYTDIEMTINIYNFHYNLRIYKMMFFDVTF